MSEPKRHHEVPKMILRNFADRRGLLQCYRKDTDRTFQASPNNAFLRKRSYAKRDHRGLRRDTSKESEMGQQVDGPATRVVERIVTRARAGQLPHLTPEDKYAWDMFFCVQARRTAAARADLDDGDLMRAAIEAVKHKLGPLSPKDLAEIDGTPDRRRAAVDEAWIDILTEPHGDFFEALRRKGLVVLVLESPNKSFVIGDAPILPLIPRGAMLNHRDAANLFPVAHNVAVACFGSQGHEEIWPIPKGTEGTRFLRKINLAIVGQSSMVACPSPTLIDSLRRKRR